MELDDFGHLTSPLSLCFPFPPCFTDNLKLPSFHIISWISLSVDHDQALQSQDLAGDFANSS
jgi:hypothetical protein